MRSVHGSPTTPLAHIVRRLGAAALVGVLLPAAALAQGGAPAKKDSAAVKAAADSTHVASGKRSRLSAFAHGAVKKASSAADKVEEKTGVSKETMAKAALASTGVGAAALLARPDSGSLTSRVAATAGKTMLHRVEDARAGRNGAKVGATPESPGGPTGGIPAGAMTAQQMALYRQQMAMAQAQAQAQAGAMPGYAAAGNSAEMQKLQAEYTQIAMRASAGDKEATQQMMRFSQEWTGAIMKLQGTMGVSPAQQQAAYESAMRDALRCATTGKDCHTASR